MLGVGSAKKLQWLRTCSNENDHREPTQNDQDAAEKAIDEEEESGAAGDQFKLDDDLI
jgi:hypothetical protein